MRTLDDLVAEGVQGRTVLVRSDLNVPLDDDRNITDDGRIRASVPTIQALSGAGAQVVVGRCLDAGGAALPYLPFSEVLDALARAGTALRPVLHGLLPGAAEAPRPATGDGDSGRLQVFDAVAGAVRDAAATAPLLVVLEDLHWADRSTRELLAFLLARLAKAVFGHVHQLGPGLGVLHLREVHLGRGDAGLLEHLGPGCIILGRHQHQRAAVGPLGGEFQHLIWLTVFTMNQDGICTCCMVSLSTFQGLVQTPAGDESLDPGND